MLMNGAAPVSVESHNVAAPTKRSSMHCNFCRSAAAHGLVGLARFSRC